MKKIGCDVDGVLLDMRLSIQNHIRINSLNTHNYPEEYYSFKTISSDGYLVPDDRTLYYFWGTEAISHLEFFPEAKEGINTLSHSHEIHIVTALPSQHVALRTKNLEGVNYSSLHVIGRQKKDFILDTLKPDIVIEDKPALIQQFSRAGIQVFYPDRPYIPDMRELAVPYRSWDELLEMLEGKN